MSLKPYYAQQCPACQKMLSIDVETLGFSVVCWHCQSEFVAKDCTQSSAAMDDPMNFWVKFTDHGNKIEDVEAPHWPKTLIDKNGQRRPK